jgi:TPR repeat protein
VVRHYEFGDGVLQGNEKAAFWYRLAADQGYADAQFKLGSVYAQGRLGIKKDEQESAIWYLKAAEQGHYESQREIGLRFHHGLGIEQSHIDAFYWFAIYLSRGYYIDAYIAQFRDASGAWLTLAELFAVKRRADLWFAGHPPPADAAEKSRYCREEFFKWAASHHEDDDFDPVEWMRERRREQGFSSPDEEQNAYLIQLARMHVNKVEGEVRVMRFFAPHNPEFRARAWAIRNKDHLRAYEGWRTPSGDVVALYVPERGWDAPE